MLAISPSHLHTEKRREFEASCETDETALRERNFFIQNILHVSRVLWGKSALGTSLWKQCFEPISIKI